VHLQRSKPLSHCPCRTEFYRCTPSKHLVRHAGECREPHRSLSFMPRQDAVRTEAVSEVMVFGTTASGCSVDRGRSAIRSADCTGTSREREVSTVQSRNGNAMSAPQQMPATGRLALQKADPRLPVMPPARGRSQQVAVRDNRAIQRECFDIVPICQFIRAHQQTSASHLDTETLKHCRMLLSLRRHGPLIRISTVPCQNARTVWPTT